MGFFFFKTQTDTFSLSVAKTWMEYIAIFIAPKRLCLFSFLLICLDMEIEIRLNISQHIIPFHPAVQLSLLTQMAFVLCTFCLTYTHSCLHLIPHRTKCWPSHEFLSSAVARLPLPVKRSGTSWIITYRREPIPRCNPVILLTPTSVVFTINNSLGLALTWVIDCLLVL